MFPMFRNAKRVAELEKKLDEETRLRSSANEVAERAAKDAMQARSELQIAIKRATEAERKHREQNEADLLMVSIQISKRLIEGEKKDSPQMTALLQQQANLQNAWPYGLYGIAQQQASPLSGIGAALGGIWMGH